MNIPPDRRGLFHEVDVQNLRAMGNYIRKTFAHNLAATAEIIADKDDGIHTAEALKDDGYDAYYKPIDGENSVTLTFKLEKVCEVTHVLLKEHIPMSQRVESYIIEAQLSDGAFQELARGTTVGYKKIEKFNAVSTDTIRIRITDSRVCPILSFIGIY